MHYRSNKKVGKGKDGGRWYVVVFKCIIDGPVNVEYKVLGGFPMEVPGRDWRERIGIKSTTRGGTTRVW